MANWAHILYGWLFLNAGFHEHVFEADVEAEVEVAQGCSRLFEAEVKLDVLGLRKVI